MSVRVIKNRFIRKFIPEWIILLFHVARLLLPTLHCAVFHYTELQQNKP